MSEKRSIRGIVCISNKSAYQLLHDEKRLYFVYLGNEEDYDEGKAIASLSEFTQEKGNTCILKKSLDSVECAVTQDDTTIVLTHGGKRRRFYVDSALSRKRLERVFDGTKLTVRSDEMAAGEEVFGIILLVVCFATALLRALLFVVGVTGGLRSLLCIFWMAIPPVWLAFKLHRKARLTRPDFDLAAVFFSCLFLYLSGGKPDVFGRVFLPAIVIALLMGGVVVLCEKKLTWKAAVAAGIALLFYAPGTAFCINDMAVLQTTSFDVSIEEVTNEYRNGDWLYYVTVEQDGVTSYYEITRDEYQAIGNGDKARVDSKTGLLGMKRTDIVIYEQAQTVQEAPPEPTEEPFETFEPVQP